MNTQLWGALPVPPSAGPRTPPPTQPVLPGLLPTPHAVPPGHLQSAVPGIPPSPGDDVLGRFPAHTLREGMRPEPHPALLRELCIHTRSSLGTSSSTHCPTKVSRSTSALLHPGHTLLHTLLRQVTSRHAAAVWIQPLVPLQRLCPEFSPLHTLLCGRIFPSLHTLHQ